jgi:alpha-tubulin suppressor-like RCC1 family protein
MFAFLTYQVGDTTTRSEPTQIVTKLFANTTVQQLAAGPTHVVALTTDSRIFSWGAGLAIGDGTGIDRTVPTETIISGTMSGKKIIAVAAGDSYSIALSSDGLVYAWGKNTQGQLYVIILLTLTM